MKKIIWLFFYNIFIVPILYFSLYFIALFHKKIRKGLLQRIGIFSRLKKKINFLKKNLYSTKKNKYLWFHVSSVGEFIMAKPIIEYFYKEKHNKIILTFFSPSGYEWAKDYKFAHVIDYYPLDSSWNTIRFLNTIKPNALFIVKTDIWPNMIWITHFKKIPIYMISATLPQTSKKGSHFFSRSFYDSILQDIKIIFAVHENDKERFQKISPKHKNIVLMGDTKIDAVLEKVEHDKQKQISKEMKFIRKQFDKIIIGGSCWEKDEEILISQYKDIQKNIQKQLLLILVPHEPNTENINRIQKRLEKENLSYEVMSNLKINNQTLMDVSIEKHKSSLEHKSVLIVNIMGILAELYRIADIAFVGTGRGGVHNVLEPLAWGCPVFYRTQYHNAHEAIDLVESKLAFASEDALLIKNEIISFLINKAKYNKRKSEIKKFFTKSKGATQRCLMILRKETW